MLQYEITGRLGAGGMGEVFRARDLRLDRPVAIKVLSDQSAGDPEIRERFEREARAVAALAHPGIVGIFEMPIVDGRVCLVLELLDGRIAARPSRARPAVAAADHRRGAADRRCARRRARARASSIAI